MVIRFSFIEVDKRRSTALNLELLTNSYLPICTIKIAISLGLMPEILFAAPRVLGRILENFCRDSVDKELTFS